MDADINECEMEDGLCDQECVNSDGGFFCSCFNGYRMVGGVCEGKTGIVNSKKKYPNLLQTLMSVWRT